VSAVAASLGVFWMVGSPVLRLRDLPDAATVVDAATVDDVA
jgi:hypothetical protein